AAIPPTNDLGDVPLLLLHRKPLRMFLRRATTDTQDTHGLPDIAFDVDESRNDGITARFSQPVGQLVAWSTRVDALNADHRVAAEPKASSRRIVGKRSHEEGRRCGKETVVDRPRQGGITVEDGGVAWRHDKAIADLPVGRTVDIDGHGARVIPP